MMYQLKVVIGDQPLLIPLTPDSLPVQAQPSALYTLLDGDGKPVTDGLVLVRRDDDLEIEVDGQPVAVIDEFYAETAAATYSVDGTLTPEASMLVASQDPASEDGVVWQAAEEGASPLLVAGGVAGAGAGALMLGGGGGGGGAVAASSYLVTVGVAAGPFQSSVKVELFDKDGNLLASKTHDLASGPVQFSIANGYQGPVLARVSDINGTAGDYLDEASNNLVSLGQPLRAMATADGSSNLSLSVTPLTELAARIAGVDESAPTLTDTQVAVNAEVGGLFGVDDITGPVTTVLDDSYGAGDGISGAEAYGNVLAMLSGADSTTGSIDATLEQLSAAVTTTGEGALALDQTGVELLSTGASAFESGANADKADLSDAVIKPPVIKAASAGINAQERDAGVVVKVPGAVASDSVTLFWGNQSYTVTLLQGDIGVDGIAQVAVPGTVISAAGDGEIAVHSQVNDGDLSPSVIVQVDATAPGFTSGAVAPAIDENAGAGQQVYTAAATDGGALTYSLKGSNDDALFSIDANTGAVTLTGDPDYESKAGYSFTVVATDAAGNASEQAVTLAVNDLDETAPTITSGATATAIDENSGAGQLVYTATATDSGVLTYSLKGSNDDALFSIDAATGAVTLTGDPDHESKAGYSFTVVATDAAGNASEQAVSLAVNNLDETAPTITSGATATAIDENAGAGQLVYTATSTDSGDIATGATSYSLKAGSDAGLTIDSSTGAVTLTGNPDYETKASYNFTVVATDAAGNASEQAVSLAVNNLDEVAPTITSGATATAIDENSGAGQVIYTATSTDSGDIATGATSYSLKTGSDAGLTIDSSTGAVTLTGNPDYETKASYNFTVVATDAAGNASERAVSLAVNDLDDVGPSVSNIAISAASGAQNGYLNAGDTVSVTVTLDEATYVTGTPQLALVIGGTTVQADYVSGSETKELVFNYTLLAGQADADGISIAADSLSLNGGTLKDAAGNAASLSHDAVADNAGYRVDTSAPTLTSSTPADESGAVAVGADIVLTFSENVTAGSGNIVISDGVGDTRTIAVTDISQVTISGNTVTINPATDLAAETAYAVTLDSGALQDQAGNAFGGIEAGALDLTTEAAVDTSVVVFDLVEGVSSSHSGRQFQADTAYTIYIRVDSTSHFLSIDGDGPGANDSWGTWSGYRALGSDDQIILCGNGAPVKGDRGNDVNGVHSDFMGIQWQTQSGPAAWLAQWGTLTRAYSSNFGTVKLWIDPWEQNPNTGLTLNQAYSTHMPAGVLTSQGLA